MTQPTPKPTPKPSLDILSLMGVQATSGDVGLEIECEGNRFPKHNAELPKAWSFHQDGSLRGQDNAEYVLRKPLKFAEIPKAVQDIFKTLNDYGTVLDDSNRTSVHVHLNAQTFHLNRLTSFACLYFIVEEILTEWCGEHRVGNLFCLRGIDAPGIITNLKRFIQKDGHHAIPESLHYAGLNIHALAKFGSLEIRTMRGLPDPDTVIRWVNILQRIYDMSGEYKDPRTVIEGLSGNGPQAFLQGVLGPDTQHILADVSWPHDRVSESIYRGVRLAQDLAYCRDWDFFQPLILKDDPFGRSRNKVAQAFINEMPASTLHHNIFNTAGGLSAFVEQYQNMQIQPTTVWMNNAAGGGVVGTGGAGGGGELNNPPTPSIWEVAPPGAFMTVNDPDEGEDDLELPDDYADFFEDEDE